MQTRNTRTTYTVAYRMGGTANCTWHRTLAFSTRDEARRVADDVERGGRKALVFKTHELDAIGMPVGWEA